MPERRTATREEWAAARAELLERDKELSRMGDGLARQRRELPWVPVEKEYTLHTADGNRTLAELFDGRAQLVVYHFMFGPPPRERDDSEYNRADSALSRRRPTRRQRASPLSGRRSRLRLCGCGRAAGLLAAADRDAGVLPGS